MQVHRIQNNNISFGINSKQIPFTQLLINSQENAFNSFSKRLTKSGFGNEFVYKGKKLASSIVDSGNVDLRASILANQEAYREYIIKQGLLNRQRESVNQVLRMGIGW